MALAPGVYSRNRMFQLFREPAVKRAKVRAASLRGIVAQLARASAVTLERDTSGRAGRVDHVLRYQIPAMRMTRVVELSAVELATLRIMAARARLACLPPDVADGGLVNVTLARLLEGSDDAADLARAARVKS